MEFVYKCPLNPPGYVASYGSYNMCLDTEWYSRWVADAMAPELEQFTEWMGLGDLSIRNKGNLVGRIRSRL